MPFKSEQQRRYMFSQHPNIASRWVKEEKAKAKKEKRVPNYVVAKSAFGIEHAGEEINKAGFGSLLRLGASGEKGANAALKGTREVKAVHDMSNVAAKPKDILSSVRTAQARAKSVHPPIALGTGKELVPFKPAPFVAKPRPVGIKGTGNPVKPKISLPSAPKPKVPGRASSGFTGFKSGIKTGAVPNPTRAGVSSGRLAPLTSSQKATQSGAKVGAKVRNAPAAAKGRLVATGRNVSAKTKAVAGNAKGKLVSTGNKAKNGAKATAGKLVTTGRNAKQTASANINAVKRGYNTAAAGKEGGLHGALRTGEASSYRAGSAAGKAKGKMVSTGSKAKAGAKAAPGRLMTSGRNVKTTVGDNAHALKSGYRMGRTGQEGGLHGALRSGVKTSEKAGRGAGKAVATRSANKASKVRIKAVQNGPKSQVANKDINPATAALAGGALVGAGAGGAALVSRRRKEQ